MRTADPHRVEIALVRTTRAVKRAFNQWLAPIGLTMTHGALLSFVDEYGSLTQRELADLLHITRVSTGTFIDALEERNLVRRTDDPADRRVWLITLTEDGAETVREFYEIDRQLREHLRAGFTRDERQQLAQFLERLETNADIAVLPPDDLVEELD